MLIARQEDTKQKAENNPRHLDLISCDLLAQPRYCAESVPNPGPLSGAPLTTIDYHILSNVVWLFGV